MKKQVRQALIIRPCAVLWSRSAAAGSATCPVPGNNVKKQNLLPKCQSPKKEVEARLKTAYVSETPPAIQLSVFSKFFG